VPGVGAVAFTWDRMAQLVDALGPEFDTKITAAALGTDVKVIATAVAIGHGGLSPDEVMRMSPPVQPTINALLEALNLAFHGQKVAPHVAGENPTMARRVLTLLVAPFRRLAATD